jgi:hypothetical protein
MIIETRNNGLFDYTHVHADSKKILLHIGSSKPAGKDIALGYDYVDRVTGKALKEPIKLRVEDVLEAWNDTELENDSAITAGELLLKDGIVYKAIISHRVYDVVNNLNTFYSVVSSLSELQEGAYPEWSQPAGAHDAYHTGQRVVFNGEVWESKIDNNVWSPLVYPAGWIKIE